MVSVLLMVAGWRFEAKVYEKIGEQRELGDSTTPFVNALFVTIQEDGWSWATDLYGSYSHTIYADGCAGLG
jgi:hypothetical protein